MKITTTLSLGFLLSTSYLPTVMAQQITGTPGSPSATTTIQGNQIPTPEPKFGGVIKENSKDSKPWWPPTIVPPKGAPNVLLIMTDDQGYGVSGTFGGVIPTPALDRVAKAGLRYTEFNSTALCSPTRAALITGRNHHSAGFGVITELSTGFPGYDSIIGPDNATVGAILKGNGYATSWFGKNHNTPAYQYTVAGPFDQWPVGMGFDYFYGFMGGETDQWTPYLFQNNKQIFPWVGKPDYNLITDMADEAIGYMKELNAAAPDKPFFLYYVPGGSHSPHQPKAEWVEKFKGKFDMGWNALRDQIFANQKRLGVIPDNAKLTDWPDSLPKWDTLSADQKKLFARQAEVYAGYTAYTDYEIGRVIQAVEDMGQLDNTLIIYICGDNGTSPEGTLSGTPNQYTSYNGILDFPIAEQLKFYDAWGSAGSYPHMAVAWSWAFDTPFKWTKQIASHFGGTRQGMAMSWPNRIKDAGGVRHQFHHIVDIVPTILESAGVKAPQMVDGIKQKPIEGMSMAYTFDKASANAPSKRKTQYFEITYAGVNPGINSSNAPNVLGRSYSMSAEVDVPQGGGNGMLATMGGRWGGWGLYLLNGKPVFHYNMLILAQYRWEGTDALTPGKHTIGFDYTYDGPGIAKGGSGELKVDGKIVATGKQANSIAFLQIADETFDVGLDTRTGVSEDYQVPFAFDGKIDRLTVNLGPMQLTAADQTKMREATARARD